MKSDAGLQDRVVIQEMIKTVAQSQQIQSSTQREFKGRNESHILLFVKLLYLQDKVIKYKRLLIIKDSSSVFVEPQYNLTLLVIC